MNVWKVEDTQKIEVPQEKWGNFWSGDSCKKTNKHKTNIK